MTKLKIKRGDNVIITTGKKEIKGKKGEVIEVIRKEGKDARVIVAGLNIVKKHTKPSAGNPQGGIVEKEASIHISNVCLSTKTVKQPKQDTKWKVIKK
jgi:large subunit ribosomal protein L24